MAPIDDGQQKLPLKKKLLQRAEITHGRIPGIKKIPLPAIGIIGLVASINLLVWAVCGIVLVSS
jgi:high-affinity nickel-transport protein